MSDEKKPIEETAPAVPTPEPGEVGAEQLKAMIAALQGDLEKKSAELAAGVAPVTIWSPRRALRVRSFP